MHTLHSLGKRKGLSVDPQKLHKLSAVMHL